MDELSKEEFDFLIIGTSLSNSIYACYVSSNKKKVIHVDSSYEYGGSDRGYFLKEIETFSFISRYKKTFSEYPKTNIKIELKPFLVYSNCFLIKKIKEHNADNNIHFKSVESISVIKRNKENVFDNFPVPCSKEELLEEDLDENEKKKLLFLLEVNEIGLKEGLFSTFLDTFYLGKKGFEIVVYCWCLFSSFDEYFSSDVLNGLRRLFLFTRSVGKFCRSPFIYPFYGCSDISQAFCRTCAVNGGVYVMGRKVCFDKERNAFVDGVKINAKQIITEEVCIPDGIFTRLVCYKNQIDKKTRFALIPPETFQEQKNMITLTLLNKDEFCFLYFQIKKTAEKTALNLIKQAEEIVSFDKNAERLFSFDFLS